MSKPCTWVVSTFPLNKMFGVYSKGQPRNAIKFHIPTKQVRLIKICFNETSTKVQVGKYLFDVFPVKNCLKQGDALSALFNYALALAIRRVQKNQKGLKLNGTRQLLVYADDVNILGRSIHTINRNREALVVASKEIGVEVNAEKSKYVFMCDEQNLQQNHNIKIGYKSLESVEQLKQLETKLINQNCMKKLRAD